MLAEHITRFDCCCKS